MTTITGHSGPDLGEHRLSSVVSVLVSVAFLLALVLGTAWVAVQVIDLLGGVVTGR